MFRDGDTYVGTLRVRARGDSPNRPALQRRISFLLNTVDFRAPGIPPAGTLVVQHQEDPLPGKLAASEFALKATPAWEQALKRSLQEKYRAAVRPVRGYIPPDAGAVFFEDEGQMLAALALDISRGFVHDHWWWNVILKNMQLSLDPDLKTFLYRVITLLPAILHHLAEEQSHGEVLDKLSPDQALTILRTLGQTFNLPELQEPVFPFHPGAATPSPGDNSFYAAESPVEKEKGTSKESAGNPQAKQYTCTAEREPSQITVNPPWQEWFSFYGIHSYMLPEHAALLGIGLTLFHSPAKARTASFTQAFHTWYYHEQMVRQSLPSPTPTPGTLAMSPTISPAQESLEQRQPTTTVSSPGIVHEIKNPPMPTESNMPSVSAVSSVVNMSYISNKQEPAALARIRFEESGAAPPETSAKQAWAEQGIETQLGGVFYLVNLAERLAMPSRIHEACGQNEEISPWAILELLARALLGDRNPGLETDPVWCVLTELDGREPGTHPANLYPHVTLWIEKELPGIRAILHKVLGSPTAENPEPEKTMLLYPARVYVTSTHVDIVMSLEDISLPVRLAGLDRDPGWMPEYTRIILFHYI